MQKLHNNIPKKARYLPAMMPGRAHPSRSKTWLPVRMWHASQQPALHGPNAHELTACGFNIHVPFLLLAPSHLIKLGTTSGASCPSSCFMNSRKCCRIGSAPLSAASPAPVSSISITPRYIQLCAFGCIYTFCRTLTLTSEAQICFHQMCTQGKARSYDCICR